MISISKDTLSKSAEAETLQDTKVTEEKIQALTKELAELVIQFKTLEQKVNDNEQAFSTDSLTALTGTIQDLFSTNIEADVFNSDKHSFSTGLEAHFLAMQPGTIVYAHTEESYILIIWLSADAYIAVTPNRYVWQINRDYTLSLPSGDPFKFSYIGTGANDSVATFSGALRLINSGCTLKGNLNAEYTGTTEFADGIIVDYLLQVEGQTFITGDVDIGGKITVTGDIESKGDITSEGNVSVTGNITSEGEVSVTGDITSEGNVSVTGNITTNGNAEIDGTLTVKGDIVQQGASYETHAEKLFTKKDIIFTRDGAVSALTDEEVTGIQAKLYDGTNDGQLVFGKDGVARVGDVGDTQPILTREETPVDKGTLFWDDTNKKAVSRVVTGFYVNGSCSSAGSASEKTVSIAGYVLTAGDILGISFENANTYGETTITTPTYPTLSVNGGTAYPICDSRGNYAGKGCWNNNDYIELRFTGSKFCIINSDIRESVNGTSGYTIYSNGYCRQWGRIRGSAAEVFSTYTFTVPYREIPTITLASSYWFDSNVNYAGIMIREVTSSKFDYCTKNENSSYYNYWVANGTI